VKEETVKVIGTVGAEGKRIMRKRWKGRWTLT
jgi:hypothetical protein